MNLPWLFTLNGSSLVYGVYVYVYVYMYGFFLYKEREMLNDSSFLCIVECVVDVYA